MGRKLPMECPAAPEKAFEDFEKERICQTTYHIELVTPLFGGGAVPGENDPVTLIRGPGIRGNLRFWWRATRGAKFKNIDDLRKREGEIWGTASYPSPVTIIIKDETKSKGEQWARYELDQKKRGVKSLPKPIDKNFKMYALFPFKGKAEKGIIIEQPSIVTTKASFNLVLKWPRNIDLFMEIEAAVWAWVNFGGLGARTRRGCGALYCSTLSPSWENVNSLKNWYKRCLDKYSIELPTETRGWPTLPTHEEILLKTKNNRVNVMKPLEAWSKTIEALENFRQGTGIGRRSKNKGKYGRSLWPEADSLRNITGQAQKSFQNRITGNKDAFPRAEFGLPIVFHFKDGSPKGNDPADCELLPPCDLERMSSPLILKPLAVSPDQAVSIILPLRTNLPGGVTVKYTDASNKVRKKFLGEDYISGSHLSAYTNSPLRFASSSGSALEAFLEYARSREGFC